MKKNISNKVVTFFIVMFCVFASLSVTAFATDNTKTITGFDDVSYTLPDFSNEVTEHKYYLLTYQQLTVSNKKVKYYTIYCFDKSLNIKGSTIYFDETDGNVDVYRCKWYDGETTWSKVDENTFCYDKGYNHVIDCSSNLLKYKDNLSNVEDGFFLTPPVTEGTLAPIVQETGLEGVLQEIVQILPVVLMTIVGLIGLRKALAMLSRVLHQS